MKRIFVILLLWCSFLGLAQAAPTVADVKNELISQFEKDGVISVKAATEARVKYVTPADLGVTEAVAEPSLWDKYASWSNFIKVLGVILLLIAFNGVLRNIIKGLWHLIAAVPVEVYQLGALGFTVVGTLVPAMLWASPHTFYLALFCSFANLMLIGWILATHPELEKALAKLFNLGLPIGSVVSFWLFLYFGALTFYFKSEIFGFFTMVAFSGMLSFAITYRPRWGVLELGFNEKLLPAVVFGNLALLATYVGLSLNGALPTWFSYFKVGADYYVAIAMGVGLLCGSSPFWDRKDTGLYVASFIIIFALSTLGFHVFDFKVISSIVMVFFVLFVLEWLAYLTFSANWILGCAAVGGALYGLSVLFESYGSALVFAAK